MAAKKLVTPVSTGGIYKLDTASWRDFRPVIDKTRCVECGICLTFCPVCSIIRTGGKYEITYDYCKGCGLCAHECPKQAIDMMPEHGVGQRPAKGGQ
ncbi:MAG: 4Fe-4S binding protein [Deltaproteobacteria bacterium]|jgi:2-oxoacid:acceptor oxidoreductase delta subunit (pyruvate/2-ketoisovalerate family)|nr:4Fe-4S binding protein [Deltaproteobacteria bacterium]